MKISKKIILVLALLCISTMLFMSCLTMSNKSFEESNRSFTEPKRSFSEMKRQAEAGDAVSQYYLGLMYASGDGVEKDSKQAVYWWKKSAKQGDRGAQNALGIMYNYGDGVKQDYKQAVYWYAKSAEQGYAYAQNNLATMYYNGDGIKQNYKKALYWYIESAKKNNPLAQNNLGIMYENGDGVAKNYAQAFYWYAKAANDGDDSAQEALNRINKKLSKFPVKLGEKVYRKVYKDRKYISKWVKCTAIAELDKRGNEIYKTYNYKTSDTGEILNRAIWSFFNDKGDIFFRDIDGLEMWIDLKYDEKGNLIYLKQHNNWVDNNSGKNWILRAVNSKSDFIIGTATIDGQEILYEYDAYGRKIAQKSEPFRAFFNSRYIYDKKGHLIRLEVIGDAGADSEWKYNSSGKLIYFHEGVFSDDYWYQYDKAGNLVYCKETDYDFYLKKLKIKKEYFYEYIDIPTGKLRITYEPF